MTFFRRRKSENGFSAPKPGVRHVLRTWMVRPFPREARWTSLFQGEDFDIGARASRLCGSDAVI
jgi:hypothetical protein